MKLIETIEYEPILLQAFTSDPELLTKYHINSGTSLNDCVNRTKNDLELSDSLAFYKIELNDEFYGFIGWEKDNFLTTFFINPKFRNQDGFNKFKCIIKDNLKFPLYTAMWEKNTRAINFLINLGAKIEYRTLYKDNVTVIMKFNEVI